MQYTLFLTEMYNTYIIYRFTGGGGGGGSCVANFVENKENV